MHVVVISKDQPSYIAAFEAVLSSFEHIYVIDRPTVQYPSNIPAIINTWGTGFLAGRMRDLGATYFGDTDDILFLDGDKVPSGNLESLQDMPYDCILLGTKNDTRKKFSDGSLLFDGTTHKFSFHEDKLHLYNNCYSCGILYRKHLIKRFRELNAGRIFHPWFDGRYGNEDIWNGDIMNYEGYNVGCTSEVVLDGKIEGGSTKKLDYGRIGCNVHRTKAACGIAV